MAWFSLFVPFFPNMASDLPFPNSLLLSVSLFKGLEEVSNNDGNSGASEQLQLPPPAGVSGGQRCWTV